MYKHTLKTMVLENLYGTQEYEDFSWCGLKKLLMTLTNQALYFRNVLLNRADISL